MHIDYYILAFSAVTVFATIFMGFWSAKKSKTASDFFVAGRSVGVGMNASAISGEYLSAASFMGIAGMVMSSGYDALWYPVCYACGYLFLLLFIAGPLRRFGAYTIPDFAEGRFDSPLFRKIAVCFVLFIGFFYTMPQMKGAGTTLAYIFPGLPYWAGVVLVGAVITLNVALGGMKGITLVQAFQYWAKMFAISVPIFVLMAVYGHYGKQLGANSRIVSSQAQVPIDPAKFPGAFHEPWTATLEFGGTLKNLEATANRYDLGKTLLTLRTPSSPLDATVATYESVRPHVGNTIIVHIDKDIPGGKAFELNTSSVTGAGKPSSASDLRKQIEQVFTANGLMIAEVASDQLVVVFSTNLTKFKLAGAQTAPIRTPLPEKAPKDETWLSPFGPLTTKAAKAANASVRWNLSAENRAALRDFSGTPARAGFRGMMEAAGEFVEGIGGKNPAASAFQFSDWTNMPPNTSRSIPGGIPILSMLREYGLLLGRPVLVATNLPRPKLVLNGSFQSRDEFVNYLDALLLTNGVRLSFEQGVIKALAAADWETYQKTPGRISFVPNRFFGTRVNADIKALAYQYGSIGEGGHREDNLEVLFATNFPTRAVDFNSTYDMLLVHEARPLMEKALAENGVTLLHASSKEVWAVPTSDIARYREPPVNARAYSLLYTYSLIIALVCGTAGLPHILVRFYTNPDGVAAKRTTMWVMILIGIFYVFPPVFGVMGRNLFPELYSGIGAKGTDKIVLELPRLLNEKYAPLGSILSGITCAGAFAAFMSTFSGLLVSMTGAMAHDVYGRILRPKATAEERMRMFKIFAVIIGGVAVLLGSFVEALEINFMVGQAFAIAAASYFPLLFMAVWWRKLTMKGAATGMLTGGLSAVAVISLSSFSTLAATPGKTGELFAMFKPLNEFWAQHPLLRILCDQPAIWAVPLAIGLMIVVSKLTQQDVPPDIRMKMLVLHAPEKLGLKQEYIQEHQAGGH